MGRYLLAHIEESSYATLAKISRESGVSETTVIRFAYTLGFESFSTMQNALRAELLGESEREKAEEDEDNVYFGTLKREIEVLEKPGKHLALSISKLLLRDCTVRTGCFLRLAGRRMRLHCGSTKF